MLRHTSIASQISLLVAAFAALVSLVSLVWNIINSILARTARLRIELTVIQQMVSDPIRGLGNPIPYFNVRITNVGSGTRYIKNPTFAFRKPKTIMGQRATKFQVINATSPITYPIELPVGKEHNHYASIENFLSNFKGQLENNEKVWIEAEDTHNKKYGSNAIKMALAYDAAKTAGKFPVDG